MPDTTLIGFAAAILTTIAFVPQVLQILRSGNVDGISVGMYCILISGVSQWLGGCRKTTTLDNPALKTGSKCSFTPVNSAFSSAFALPSRRSRPFATPSLPTILY